MVPTPSTKPDPKISDGADDKSPGEGGDPEDGDDPEQKQPVTDDRPPHVSFRRQEDGRWTLNANLSPEQGALVETALQEARDRAFLAAEDPDERLRLTWADSFIDLARRSLAHADAAGAEGTSTERTLVHLHYELGRLYPEGSDQPLPDAVARQILCDTNLVTVGFKDGRPVDIGRKTRADPQQQRPPPDRAPTGRRLCGAWMRGHSRPRDPPSDPLGRRWTHRCLQPSGAV